MSDEPTERDVEALAEILAEHVESATVFCKGCDWIPAAPRGDVEAQFRTHLAAVLAERIAEARREGAIEALGEAIEAAHVERRRVWDEDRNEPLMLDQHWGAAAGWLAWRTRAIERGDEPDWPDAMNAKALRDTP